MPSRALIEKLFLAEDRDCPGAFVRIDESITSLLRTRFCGRLSFRGANLTSRELKRWRKSAHGSSIVGTIAGVTIAYTLLAPGVRIDPQQIALAPPPTQTSALFIPVSGTVKNPAIKAVTLVTNGSRRPVTVQNGTFATKVPLIPGENRIQAITRGVASVPIKIIANIPRSDIWMELSWAGEGDIDLHLYLPNGQHCFYQNKSTSGAMLDVDNTQRDGPEHIVMEHAIPGKYRATVLYYRAAKQPPPPVDWQVTVRLRDGRTRQTFTGRLSYQGEEQTVSTFTFP